MSAFDPEAFCDRKAEQELFDGVLTFKSDGRIITIRDDKDKGKSVLLRLLQYKCQYATETPVCLVALDELHRAHSAVRYIVTQLADEFRLEFPRFREVEKQRLDGRAQALTGTMDVENMTGGKAATLMAERDMYVLSGPMDDDRQEELRTKAIDAFEGDLCELATERPIVLLFDAYEVCSEEIERWLPRFLQRRVFDAEGCAPNLVVVIAGQTVPTAKFNLMLGPRFEHVVASVEQLSLWEREHVAAFLERNGFKGEYDDEDVDWICAKLKKGWTIGRAADRLRAAMGREDAA
jgi:hypothetical protein